MIPACLDVNAWASFQISGILVSVATQQSKRRRSSLSGERLSGMSLAVATAFDFALATAMPSVATRTVAATIAAMPTGTVYMLFSGIFPR